MRRTTARALVAGLVAGAAMLVPIRPAWGAPETKVAVLASTNGLTSASAAGGTPAGGQTTPFPASHLGVRWRGSEDALVSLRWQGQDGTWQPWEPVVVDHDMEDPAHGVVYGRLGLADGATRVESRVTGGDAAAVEIVAIDTRYGDRPVQAEQATAGASFDPTAKVPQPATISRAEWGADESIRSQDGPSYAPVSKLIVHHTADDSLNDPDPAATVRAIYAYHVRVRGWDDIGYNFLIDAAGRVYEGRWSRQYGPGQPASGDDADGNGVIGAHAGGFNAGSVGIALLGNFQHEQLPAAALESLRAMLAWEADRHDIDVLAAGPYAKPDGSGTVTTPNIAGHRDTKPTACPGDILHNMLPSIRDEVDRRVESAYGTTRGYWVAGADGRVLAFGEARDLGSMAGRRLNARILGLEARPAGDGYWLLGSDGGIFSFGAGGFYGSTGGLRLNRPVVGMAVTPSGGGYWLVASDGGIFAFGDAGFYGSSGGLKLNQPVVGMASTPSGRGYWLVASDGGIFAFGDASFRGSTGSIKLNSPIVGMERGPAGNGYWMVARDGGVFAFNVPFKGSMPGLRLASQAPTVTLRATTDGRGYYLLGADGGIFPFGRATFLGSGSLKPSTAASLSILRTTS